MASFFFSLKTKKIPANEHRQGYFFPLVGKDYWIPNSFLTAAVRSVLSP